MTLIPLRRGTRITLLLAIALGAIVLAVPASAQVPTEDYDSLLEQGDELLDNFSDHCYGALVDNIYQQQFCAAQEIHGALVWVYGLSVINAQLAQEQIDNQEVNAQLAQEQIDNQNLMIVVLAAMSVLLIVVIVFLGLLLKALRIRLPGAELVMSRPNGSQQELGDPVSEE